ncbi:MAG: PTS sugar transporter subunit IIA [Treponema sp.]|nr:PTS sugar transporter subunit IIA [Treponema sp.]
MSEVFNIQHIKPNLESQTKDEAFEELVETINALHPELNRREMLEAVTMREKQMNTAVAPGVAVPRKLVNLLNSQVLSKMRIAQCTQEVHDILCQFEQTDMRGLI